MKILTFAHGLWLGGAQLSTLEFFELLSWKGGVDLRVAVCGGADEGFIGRLRALGVEYGRVACATRFNLPSMDVSAVEDWLEWADVAWITDIELLAAPRIKRVKRIPVIAHLHSYPLLCPPWGLLYGMREVCYEGCSLSRIVRCKQLLNEELSRLGILGGLRSSVYKVLDYVKGPLDYFEWRKALRGAVDSIDGFVAVSNFMKRVHEDLILIEGKPFEVVYNPVINPLKHLRRLESAESIEGGGPRGGGGESNMIVYASGSNPMKGPHLLLQAAKMLLDGGERVRLLLTGCKGTWVEKYASKLGLGEGTVCTGRVPFEVLYRLMYEAKVVVMPSIWPEPFGRVPVEANRFGTVAVVTDRGGLPETVVPGVTGFVAEAQPEDLAEKILMAMRLKRSREVVRKTSLSRINPDDSVKVLLKFFERLL